MNLSFTDAAEADLEAIGDYIAQASPLRAVSFIRDIRSDCADLLDIPMAFQLVKNHETTGIRRRVHGNYLIFYRVHAQTVQILRVLHGAMDYERLMFSEDE